MSAKTDAQWQQLFNEAWAVGLAAGNANRPTPIIVSGQHGNQISHYYVEDGVCGFAYVRIKPATHSFARWANKMDLGFKSYHGGYDISIHEYNQSYDRKMAHAQAMAAYLREKGIPADAHGRLD